MAQTNFDPNGLTAQTLAKLLTKMGVTPEIVANDSNVGGQYSRYGWASSPKVTVNLKHPRRSLLEIVAHEMTHHLQAEALQQSKVYWASGSNEVPPLVSIVEDLRKQHGEEALNQVRDRIMSVPEYRGSLKTRAKLEEEALSTLTGKVAAVKGSGGRRMRNFLKGRIEEGPVSLGKEANISATRLGLEAKNLPWILRSMKKAGKGLGILSLLAALTQMGNEEET